MPLWPILIVIFVAGCSSSSDTASSILPGPGGGTHPVDFLSTHPSTAVSDVDACTICHGDDLTGGIANTSCFTAACHHDAQPNWVVLPSGPPQGHGISAKRKPGSSGFVSCQICHADDFSGGGAGVSCFLCHASAPHASQWRTGDTYVHTNADPDNAPVCAQCHLDGANSPIAPPSPPAPAGTPPGCFNSTLCHGVAGAPHPVGGTWVTASPAPQPHGNDAKAVPGATTGFNYCQVCHGTGTDFAGGSSGISCYTCHGASAPHPASWRTGDTYVHTNTAEGNASVCAFCHTGGANSPVPPPSPPAPGGTPPGCFNSTLCHAAGVPHPVGGTWVTVSPAAQPHGNDAKAVPGATTGFNYCQVCHGTGTDFAGGSSGTSCYPCHGASAPHPASWRTGDTYVHTTVAEGNVSVCAFCHTGGANSPIPPPSPPAPGGTPPGCFNSTLCHGEAVPAGTHGTGWLDFDNSAAFHGSFVTSLTCETAACHPISGHPTCTSCHFDDQGSRAYTPLGFTHNASVFTNHRDGDLASDAGTICENCHQTSRTFPAGSPPSCQGGGQNHPTNDGCHYNESLL
ncbi:MAG: hypothetical protein WBF16_03480, partial [Candidatus Deferrimicrobiaceae bacterium]